MEALGTVAVALHEALGALLWLLWSLAHCSPPCSWLMRDQTPSCSSTPGAAACLGQRWHAGFVCLQSLVRLNLGSLGLKQDFLPRQR